MGSEYLIAFKYSDPMICCYRELTVMSVSNLSRKITLVAVIGVSAFAAVYLSLNYFGVCFKECRILSGKERISIAVDYVLSTYPPAIDMYERDGDKLIRVGKEIPSHPVYYSGATGFLSLNKDCCRVTRTGREGYATRLEHRLIGSANTFVEVKYEVKYVDANNTVQSVERIDYVAISNCGHPWSGI